MRAAELEIGKTYQYFPSNQDAGANEHYPATVLKVGKLARVKIVSVLYPDGYEKTVSPRRLLDQLDLLS